MRHLKIIYFSNSWEHLLAAGLVILALFLILYTTKQFVSARLFKKASTTTTHWDDILAETVKSTSVITIFVFSLLCGVYILDLPDEVNTVNGCLPVPVRLVDQQGDIVMAGLQGIP